jgi:hypothetical protein
VEDGLGMIWGAAGQQRLAEASHMEVDEGVHIGPGEMDCASAGEGARGREGRLERTISG